MFNIHSWSTVILLLAIQGTSICCLRGKADVTSSRGLIENFQHHLKAEGGPGSGMGMGGGGGMEMMVRLLRLREHQDLMLVLGMTTRS